jgi:hypothetical protein
MSKEMEKIWKEVKLENNKKNSHDDIRNWRD